MAINAFTYAGIIRDATTELPAVLPAIAQTDGGTIRWAGLVGDITTGIETLLFHTLTSGLPSNTNIQKLTFEGGKIKWSSYSSGVGPMFWSAPISSNAWHEIEIKLYKDTNNIFEVWDNGVKLTVTVDTSQSQGYLLPGFSGGIWAIGGECDNAGVGLATNLMNKSTMYTLSIWNTRLTDAEVKQLGIARKLNLPLQIKPANLVEHFAFDQLPVGQAVSACYWLGPNADVAATWSTATPHWNKPASYDTTTYLQATSADSNKTEKLAYGTFTIPTGYSIYRLDFTYKLMNNAAITGRLKRASGDITYDLPGTVDGGGTPQITYNSKTFYTKFTQAEVDNFELWMTTGTMGKSSNCQLYWLPAIFVVRNRQLMSIRKGSVNYLDVVNSLAAPAVSVANKFLTY